MNDLDWEHVIEEIEDLGNSEIAVVSSLPDPGDDPCAEDRPLAGQHGGATHWTGEAADFLQSKRSARYCRSMAGPCFG